MTGFTGYTGVANTNAFTPPADITAVYEHFDPLIDPSVATSTDLPSSGNWVGRSILVVDIDRVLVWHGSGWSAPSVGSSAVVALQGTQTLTTTATAISGLSNTVTLPAVPVRLKATLCLINAVSGADRVVAAQFFDGSTALGPGARNFLIPSAAGLSVLTSAVLIYTFTPSAGAHTFTVKANASISSAVTVSDCDLEVTIL